MMNFCTLFDSNYISKGIALYLSIAKHTDDFIIYVMAMDRKCEDILKKLNFSNLKVECIDDNMSPELTKAKENRSRAEFCWTCGSYITHLFLTKYDLDDITYLDSDLMFFSSPKVIFDELRGKNASVGLSPHFIPYNASGKYCVQYCYFKNDKDGLNALTWWKNECLKWCYSIIEDGKYGDQMYLNYMPLKFNNVVDIENIGAGMAYWNSFAYKYTEDGVIYKNHLYPFVYFHYSGININYNANRIIVKECFYIDKSIKEIVVRPYVDLLREIYANYLNKSVNGVEYTANNYQTMLIKRIDRILQRYIAWHWLRNFLIGIKYKRRLPPYSEKGK